MVFVFILIIFAATFIGSICGMGGGVIIKPLLDAASDYTPFQISVISGLCVLAMSAASLVKRFAAKQKFELPIVIGLTAGSIAGGLVGDIIFTTAQNAVISSGINANAVTVVQNAMLGVFLLFVLSYMIFIQPKDKHFNVKNPVVMTLLGFILGVISTFLGIGGGPIDVCVFCLVCGMTVKDSGANSLITIFFAQAAKIVKMAITGAFVTQTIITESLAVWVLVIMMSVSVIGGLVGAIINKKMSQGAVRILYCSALGFVAVLCVFNIIVKLM